METDLISMYIIETHDNGKSEGGHRIIMQKVIISILGQDRSGLLAAISQALLSQDCNIENVSETILQSIFSAIFIISKPSGLSEKVLEKNLREAVAHLSLDVAVKPFHPEAIKRVVPDSQPFIITTSGPDKKGLVAGISGVLAGHGGNITNLKAAFKGGDNPLNNMMIYEVDVPNTVPLPIFHADLKKKASELGIEINIQHRRIFEAINRI
jgi:glycine cleavage system transcriptional repressor